MMEKYYITWDDIFKRLRTFEKGLGSDDIVYGVPKAGMILTGLLNNVNITTNPDSATVILDDLIDSGKTAKYYMDKYPDAGFYALYNKKSDDTRWYVFPWEQEHPGGEDSIEQNIVRQLQYIGEDPDREGLKDTPRRVIKSWEDLFSGYNQTAEDFLTVFESNGYDQIVLLKDIELYSFCEHHMLPFYGKAHVAYIPDGKVIGISKLARLLDMFARRLQIQERIGQQVTDALMNTLKPKGAACIIEARHTCMCMRGVNKQHSIMSTSSLRGVFYDHKETREELLSLIK